MKTKLAANIIFMLGASVVVFGQHGGKAEPKRIAIPTGKTSVTISGSLSNGQEMEYVFSARKGQIVTVKNAGHNLFDFRVFNDEFDFETEFDSSPRSTFDLPETGDYLFFVRKKMAGPRRARFSMVISIR
jgi:hypothetical protein